MHGLRQEQVEALRTCVEVAEPSDASDTLAGEIVGRAHDALQALESPASLAQIMDGIRRLCDQARERVGETSYRTMIHHSIECNLSIIEQHAQQIVRQARYTDI